MYTNNKLSKAVRLAIAFGATSATAFTASVAAQETEEAAAKVEKIQVTGSRIQRADIESANPITVFSAEDLAASGHVTIEGFIQSIPSMNGGMNGRQTNNGSGGAASASMRGLGSARTLILINGRRTATGDLNTIPMGFIERVEVLRDGASTIYGSDAIAGVVNFITKRDFEGGEVIAQYDVTGESDGEARSLSVTLGTSSNRGNAVLSLEYSDRKAIWQGDREFSAIPWGESGGQRIMAGSGANSFGTWSPYDQNSPYFGENTDPNSPYFGRGAWVVDPQTGDLRRYNQATDSYNFAPASYLVTPQKVFSANATANYELTKDISAFLEAGFTNRQSDQLMAADGTFWGARMTADHPDNPIGEDISVNRRLEETGGRSFRQDYYAYRMVAGLEGSFDNGWSWDVSYNYARFTNASLDIGRANPARYNKMLNPSVCLATNSSGAYTDPACAAVGIWNPLEANSLTPEQVAYGSVPNSPLSVGVTKQFMANLTGDTGDFGFDAGSIGWAVGYERRDESLVNTPDGGAVVGEIYGVTAAPTEGSYSVDEMFAEINLPLLAGVTGAERLDVSAAVRLSDYDFLSSHTTTKFGVEYVPVQGLLLRATFSDGFRAPSISNLYAPLSESNLSYVDPCHQYGSSNVSQTTKNNCAAEGLSPTIELTNLQSSSIVGGNPDLGPEESESYTVGFVYSPNFVQNLSIAVDYYNIEITNGIGAPSITALVAQCYGSENFSAAACDYLQGPTHPVVNRPAYPGSDYRALAANPIVAGIIATPQNIATFETSGIDFDVNWHTDILGGRFNVRLDGTYLRSYEYQSLAGTPVLEMAGKFGADPNLNGNPAAFSKIRSNLSLSYSADNWNVLWVARYQSSVDDINYTPTLLSSSVGSYIYHDLQGSYTFQNNLSLTAGVRNLFDKQPPYVTNNNDMNTLNTSYDTAGQYLYARLAYRF
ncbi:TonB-dependent receptor [Chromatiaceae bacterium AAb-1]|nr:TonB-dependent receptor [Chromatiaceae bacterium AAb-1]